MPTDKMRAVYHVSWAQKAVVLSKNNILRVRLLAVSTGYYPAGARQALTAACRTRQEECRQTNAA